MPNIELIGYGDDKANQLFEEIGELFKGNPIRNQMVVTIYRGARVMAPVSKAHMPFIRVAVDKMSWRAKHRLLFTIAKLGQDMEVLSLSAFYEKGKMRAPKSKVKKPAGKGCLWAFGLVGMAAFAVIGFVWRFIA